MNAYSCFEGVVWIPEFLGTWKEVHVNPIFRGNAYAMSDYGCTFLVIIVIDLDQLIGDLINCFIRVMFF